MREPKGSETSQENLQSQISWAHGESVGLNGQSESMNMIDLCSSYAMGSSYGAPKAGAGVVSAYTDYIWIL